jgi:hypothetical protein
MKTPEEMLEAEILKHQQLNKEKIERIIKEKARLIEDRITINKEE